MIDLTVIVHAGCIELGLLAGYGLCSAHRFICECRRMVDSFAAAMHGSNT